MLICPYCEQDDVWEVQFVGLEQNVIMCLECETICAKRYFQIYQPGTNEGH